MSSYQVFDRTLRSSKVSCAVNMGRSLLTNDGLSSTVSIVSAMSAATHIEPCKTAGRERLVPNPKARLREQFHEVCRFKHLSVRTEEAYWGWLRRFLIFHKQGGQWRHPRALGAGVDPV